MCIFTHIFANTESHDFKASSVLLPDASNEKLLLFLAVRLTHTTCPAHSVYSIVSNIRRLENIGKYNEMTLT